MNTKVELNEMEMNQVAGGRIRIRLHGPRKNSIQRIKELIDMFRGVKDAVETKIQEKTQEKVQTEQTA
ncbi:hypothetical protein [Anaerovibrio sp.]|uniref:hypothetical protein n=1 Tax=Anaerovibrio sp. TaxID=1872532 RepID=UPI001B7BF370|nr:hypothetical protein [Anaerovibrio sp.]MBP3231066.1 hypothetical protein [Anaerovibrio sp.]MBR2143818.1 hypothetical protein [Anaerovibrio sp.]